LVSSSTSSGYVASSTFGSTYLYSADFDLGTITPEFGWFWVLLPYPVLLKMLRVSVFPMISVSNALSVI